MLKKILVRGLLTGVAFILLVPMLFLVANWRDENLRPEVQETMVWHAPKSISDDNAYLLLLGLNAKESVDPLVLGKRKLAQQIQQYEKSGTQINEFVEHVVDPDEIKFVQPKLDVCDYVKTSDCVAFYLGRSEELEREIINSRLTLLKNFELLKLSSNFREIHPPAISAGSPSYGIFMYAAELARMKAIRSIADGKTTEGVNELLQISALSQNILEHADTLVLHMVALASLQKDLRILEEVLQRFPEIGSAREKIAEYLAQLSQDRVGIAKVFKFERQFSLRTMKVILESSSDVDQDSWETKFLKLLQRPNAALNLAYDWFSLRASVFDESRVAYSKAKLILEDRQQALLGFGIVPIYLRDPVTKILLSISELGYESYIERHDDVMAQAQVLAIKLEIIKRGIAQSDIPQFVQQHPAQHSSKLDGRPIRWHAEQQQLLFELRQPSSQRFQNEKLFRVRLSLPPTHS